MTRKKSDYIPSNNAAFNDWFANLNKYVERKAAGARPEWDHVLERDLNALLLARDEDWMVHYTPTLTPHTPDLTKARDEARGRAEKVIRSFVKWYLHRPPVIDADRIAMRLPVYDSTRTEHWTVGEEVEFVLEIRGIRKVHVKFKVRGVVGSAKPPNYDGAVILWDVLESPPERPEDLKRHTLASRTPYALEFDETERGKRVYVALAWQNKRGILGSYSEILWTIVP